MSEDLDPRYNHEEGYKLVLHRIHYLTEVGSPKLSELIKHIKDWSYAHRQGNGELTEEEQDAQVERAYLRMIAPL